MHKINNNAAKDLYIVLHNYSCSETYAVLPVKYPAPLTYAHCRKKEDRCVRIKNIEMGSASLLEITSNRNCPLNCSPLIDANWSMTSVYVANHPRIIIVFAFCT